MDSDNLKALALIVGIHAIVVLSIWSAWTGMSETADHRAAIRHNCELIRREAGQTVMTMSARGSIGFGSTADRECYRCANGYEECF